MKIKTSELSGLALDWSVTKCEGYDHSVAPGDHWGMNGWATDWAQGGPIIEREGIAIWPDEDGGFFASANEGAGRDFHGETYLIAAMRCYVASRFGDEVDVPDELMEATA